MPHEQIAAEAASAVGSFALLPGLSFEQRRAMWSRASIRGVLGGETLVRQHEPSSHIYFVVSGRFEVLTEGRAEAIAEIGVGEPIGEVGFFSGAPRMATIAAIRDSVVLALDRAAFDTVAREMPAIYEALLCASAGRLTEATARIPAERSAPAARTVAMIAAGDVAISLPWRERLAQAFERKTSALVLTRNSVARQFPDPSLGDVNISNWLNAREQDHELIIYLTDATLTEWTRKAVRQADQVLIVAAGPAPAALNPVETFAYAVLPRARRRLVRVHEQRTGVVTGTADWLREREVVFHHHVALGDDCDLKRLHRFLTGRALGFVAAGGGALGPAHLGIHKAFVERGIQFDALGGTSVGAAMLAPLALLRAPEDADRAIEDVFVKGLGFTRRSFPPRYSLLDHAAYDDALRQQFANAMIEDAWLPFFAVATELGPAKAGPCVMRSGPLWEAVRASSAIPAALPPLMTRDGRTLIDGGVVSNIPLEQMKDLKTGPNLIVHFGAAEQRHPERPGSSASPEGGRRTPARPPGPISVLMRCFTISQDPARLPLGPHDLVLNPPVLPGSSFSNFERHTEVFEASYRWCLEELDHLTESGDPALAAILRSAST